MSCNIAMNLMIFAGWFIYCYLMCFFSLKLMKSYRYVSIVADNSWMRRGEISHLLPTRS
jgi:hypothetical protein